MKLEAAMRSWGTPAFERILKQEVALARSELPLQQGLTYGSHVVESPVTVTINRITELDEIIEIHAGIFYQSIIAGCSCTDDPTPMSELTEYCDVLLSIDRKSALAIVRLISE